MLDILDRLITIIITNGAPPKLCFMLYILKMIGRKLRGDKGLYYQLRSSYIEEHYENDRINIKG